MEGIDHPLEFGHLSTRSPGSHLGRVALVRGEIAKGVVSPVVGKPSVEQERFRHRLMDREQLDGGDTQLDEMGKRCLMGQAGVGPPELLWHAGMPHGEPFDVKLIKDGVGVTVAGAGMAPLVGRIDDQTPRHVGCRVEVAGLAYVAGPIAEHLRAKCHIARDGAGVRIDEEFGRVGPQAMIRIVGSDHPVPIRLTGADAGHEAVPNPSVAFGKGEPGFASLRIEQAEVDPFRIGCGDGEVDPTSRGRSAQGCPASRGYRRG